MGITLLGSVTVDGARNGPGPYRTLGSSQARAALALLTLERAHGVARDRLADVLWPHGLPPTWSSVLRTVVSRVRSFLGGSLAEGAELLVAEGGVYRLHLPGKVRVDVEVAAEQLAAARERLDHDQLVEAQRLAADATDRLRAPFLPDRDGDWVAAQRAHLNELLVVGLEVTSQAATARADHAVALSAASDAVDLAPLREAAHRQLMAAHAAAGNRAEALRAYQRLRQTLADELGADPDSETEAAYLRLLGPSPGRLVSPGDGAPRDLPGVGAPTSLVGRESELAAAAKAWARVLSGHRHVLLVSGEAGIGKTHFATEVASIVAADGGLVLFGCCDRESAVPYGPFVEMLDAVVAATPYDELPALSPAARAELAAVLPSFPAAPAPATTHRRSVLFDAVTRLVAQASADRPLVIVLDDLQWADGDTSSLLLHLLRWAKGTRLLVVANVRSDMPADQPIERTIQALEHHDLLSRLRLGGLVPMACEALVSQVVSDAAELPGTGYELAAVTAGNPAMVVETARARAGGAPVTWPLSGPETARLDALLATRLAPLGRATRALLHAAAVSGEDFELDVVASTAGLDEAVSIDALDSAMTVGLVAESSSRADGSSYRFVHEVLRRALYRSLGGATRRHLHRRVAAAMQSPDGDDRRVAQRDQALSSHFSTCAR